MDYMRIFSCVWLTTLAGIFLLSWFKHSKYICRWVGHEASAVDAWFQRGYKNASKEVTFRGAVYHSYCPRCKEEVRKVDVGKKNLGHYSEDDCKKRNYEWVNQKEWKLTQLLLGKSSRLTYTGIDSSAVGTNPTQIQTNVVATMMGKP